MVKKSGGVYIWPEQDEEDLLWMDEKKIVQEVSLDEMGKVLSKALANELINGDTHSSHTFTTKERQCKHQKKTT